MRRRITANLLKASVLVCFLAALAAGVGWLIGRERSAALFAFCALLAAIAVYWLGDRALLGMLDARPFALAEDPLLRSATDRVAAQLRVAPPKLCLIDDGFPRAFVVGRGPGSTTLAVSTGLLRAVRRDELEAIIAHELAHVRSLDVLTQTFAVLLATILVEASRIGGFLSRALLFVFAPVAAAFTHALLSPKREFAADRDAASVCSPHDLADALLRLDRAGELVSFAASPTTEPLYTVDPFEPDRLSRMFRTHPPLAERILRLRALGISTESARARTADRPPAPPQTSDPLSADNDKEAEGMHNLGAFLPPRQANSAASYSPRGSRPKYHWRRRA